MITGWFDEMGQPNVDCRLIIPRLGTRATIRFLVDTGSNITLLHPFDIRQAGIDLGDLMAETGTTGIGGTTDVFSERAALYFTDADGIIEYSYRLDIHIARPDAYNDDFPSLLGMDVLGCWYTECDPTNGMLQFTVRRIL